MYFQSPSLISESDIVLLFRQCNREQMRKKKGALFPAYHYLIFNLGSWKNGDFFALIPYKDMLCNISYRIEIG